LNLSHQVTSAGFKPATF